MVKKWSANEFEKWSANEFEKMVSSFYNLSPHSFYFFLEKMTLTEWDIPFGEVCNNCSIELFMPNKIVAFHTTIKLYIHIMESLASCYAVSG